MKKNKVVISIFQGEDNVYRFSLNNTKIALFFIFATLPYCFIFWNSSQSATSQSLSSNKQTITLKNKEIVEAKVKAPSNVILKNETAPLKTNNDYKFSNVKLSKAPNKVDVDFILSKKIPNDKYVSGIVFVEVLDSNSRVIGTSQKSLFKFTTSRLSSFNVDLQKETKADKLKVRVLDKDNQVWEESISL